MHQYAVELLLNPLWRAIGNINSETRRFVNPFIAVFPEVVVDLRFLRIVVSEKIPAGNWNLGMRVHIGIDIRKRIGIRRRPRSRQRNRSNLWQCSKLIGNRLCDHFCRKIDTHPPAPLLTVIQQMYLRISKLASLRLREFNVEIYTKFITVSRDMQRSGVCLSKY